MKVLVLAGGFDQIALIEELQSRGHEVILADYLENPPAKKCVEKHFRVSTLDEDAVYCLALQEQVDLVITACTDQALLTAARVSEKLNLPFYLNAFTAQNITNKAYMKKKFREYAVPTTEWVLIENDIDFLARVKERMEYPFLIKPCDANSSKGVVIVNDDHELQEAVRNAFLISRSKQVIAEKFTEGQEISVDAWKDSEGVKVLLVSATNKMNCNEGKFTIYQSRYPIALSPALEQKIQDIAEKICEAFELENSPLLIQAIVKQNDINVIECSARMGGGTKYEFIKRTTGIDIMRTYVNRLLGDTGQCLKPVHVDKAVEMDYVYVEPGVFENIIGFEENMRSGNISGLFVYKTFGSRISEKATSSDRVLGFMLEADNAEELRKKRCRILEQVDIVDADDNSIMYKDCFYQDECSAGD